ncbi:hypothetical protein MtrunA17_Chr1g0204081 [Medicago truncatula]|uniref:Transmembrane protein n=1 Tax=Medicago truncatula TaxID=3880 RepID=A0A396JYR9_MEDTR|nr:hypothetical protein MtrunA17_Chr1g0204081 [Medicago truncatula]
MEKIWDIVVRNWMSSLAIGFDITSSSGLFLFIRGLKFPCAVFLHFGKDFLSSFSDIACVVLLVNVYGCYH